MTMTKREIALEVIRAIHSAIQEAGEEGIPSGHLYAMLSSKMSLDAYQGIIDVLKHAGVVTESNYLLKAVPIG